MDDGEARKEGKRLSVADGRYVTRGTPRTGGLASVYRAVDTETGDSIALKVFRTGESKDDVVEESFRREVQALSDLRHRNVVRILTSGRDNDHGLHYIAMEWVERDLKTLCETRRFTGWEEYYRCIGRGVLDALVFAHSRSTVHRDIKPSNVLVTDDGDVKLCDFGISKIRNFLAPGVTLAQFATAPFAPPEPDDGSYSYSRDVFGFAALSTAVLSTMPVTTHSELVAGLEVAPIEEPIRRVLRKALTLDNPAARQANAVMLLAELERLLPLEDQTKAPVVLFGLTLRVKNIVEADTGLKGEQTEGFVERDLEGARGEQIPPSQERPGQGFRLYGNRYGYTAVRDDSGTKFRFVDALEYAPSEMERRRTFASELGVRLSLRGTSASQSSEVLEALNERLLAFSADQKQRKLEQREQALYRTWLDLLSAKTELEKRRKTRVPFTARDVSGEFLRLKPVPGSGAASLGDQDIQIDVGARGVFKGVVVSASEAAILVRPSDRNTVRAEAIPEQGAAETDTTKSDVALDKQKAALEAIRYGRSVNPDLGKFVINPDHVEVPPQLEVEFIQPDIDADKKEAVVTALSGPALMLVEGPPGTGKTTFITEVVLQTLRDTPNARVLLTSQTHVALDNSLERIVKQSAGRVSAVRIGQEGDARISDTTKPLLLDAKLPELRRLALASGRAFVEKWATERGLELRATRRVMSMERHAVLKATLEDVEAGLKQLEPQLTEEVRRSMEPGDRAELDDKYQGLSKERDELERALKESLKELTAHLDSKEELAEFSACSAADLREWADAYAVKTTDGAQLKQLLLAHADWEARFGRSREFRAAVIASSQIVAGTCLGVMSVPGRNDIVYDLCIVDEASIATPTEVLVPMARARRTILVGDSKQLSPFQDPDLRTSGLLDEFGLKVQDQKATLFNHLREGLPPALRKALKTQRRMIPAIGNLVAGCFYPGELKSVEREQLPHLKGAMPRPVTWYSTSRKSNRASRQLGTTHFNDCEVEFVTTLLGRVDFFLRNGRGKGKRISVAVLTGYGEQKQRLQTAIETKKHAWVSFSEYFVNVVDAFQGREADMVIFSVTRSEAKGLGFLREMERINVALSRGREMLAIVGDHVYCQTVPGPVNPLREVLDHIRSNPADCALEELQP